jgi:hypothetical protein
LAAIAAVPAIAFTLSFLVRDPVKPIGEAYFITM